MSRLTHDPTGRAQYAKGGIASYVRAEFATSVEDPADSKFLPNTGSRGLPRKPDKHIHHDRAGRRSHRAK